MQILDYFVGLQEVPQLVWCSDGSGLTDSTMLKTLEGQKSIGIICTSEQQLKANRLVKAQCVSLSVVNNFHNSWRFPSWRTDRKAESHTGAAFCWLEDFLSTMLHCESDAFENNSNELQCLSCREQRLWSASKPFKRRRKQINRKNLRAQTKAVLTICEVPVGVKC